MKSESRNQFAFHLEQPAVKLLRDPDDRALRLRQVCQLTGLGRSMIYQMQAEGRFPQRIKLGQRAVGWLESEVRDWLATRIETSRSNQPGAT
ncbi:MAG: helix-turn-helix transcriptional regulator [Steroidobacteraceae bacterium]